MTGLYSAVAPDANRIEPSTPRGVVGETIGDGLTSEAEGAEGDRTTANMSSRIPRRRSSVEVGSLLMIARLLGGEILGKGVRLRWNR